MIVQAPRPFQRSTTVLEAASRGALQKPTAKQLFAVGQSTPARLV